MPHDLERGATMPTPSRTKVTLDKCKFMQKSVEYLGHKLDASGLHPTTAKIKAVVDTPTQKNMSELKSYLWLLNYYGRFLPNLSTKKAFESSKKALIESSVLVHYDSNELFNYS